MRANQRGQDLRSFFCAAMSLLALGCGSEPNGFERGCETAVSFQVGAGLTPQIDWSPDCKLGVLRISGVNGIMWQLRARDQMGPDNLIAPALRYGEPPASTTVEAGPLPLVTGEQYGIQAWVVDLNGQAIGAGEASFQR
jgi:hypothetical protein